jgi:5-methylcytosine-specific restriction endonuclease McrA
VVHHIEPYRVAANNEPTNLVTTCTRCHPRLERISDRIARMPARLRPLAVLLVASMLDERWHIHQGLRLFAEAA